MSTTSWNDEWLLSELLRQPRMMFVLWAAHTGLWSTIDEFRTHFGDDLLTEDLLDELAYYQLLRVQGAELQLTDLGGRVAADFAELEQSDQADATGESDATESSGASQLTGEADAQSSGRGRRQTAGIVTPSEPAAVKDPLAFAKLLRHHRSMANLTQAQLAEKAGLSLRTVAGWERGRAMPRLDVVQRLADALGLSSEERVALESATRKMRQVRSRESDIGQLRAAAPGHINASGQEVGAAKHEPQDPSDDPRLMQARRDAASAESLSGDDVILTNSVSAPVPTMDGPRVFISHSHKDDALAQRLFDDLAAAEADVWMDVPSFNAGNFLRQINDALSRCEYVVLVLTEDALASAWVQQEINAAIRLMRQGRIRDILPIQAGKVDYRHIPPLWGVYHTFDATRDYHTALGGVLRALGLPRAAAAAPLHPAASLLTAARILPDLSSRKLFISYRRDDSGDISGHLYDRLEAQFGRENIFKDVGDISGGSDFRSTVRQTVAQSAVMLVVIGPEWLDITNEDGRRRLEDPNDFVRVEVEAALTHGIPVIPVLVRGAGMPRAEDLPTGLAPLSYYTSINVRHGPHFQRDLDGLVISLTALSSSAGDEPWTTSDPIDVGAKLQQNTTARAKEADSHLLGALVAKIAALGGRVISDGILTSIQQRLMQREVSKAIDKALDRAIDRFEKNVHNNELLRAIAAQKGYWADATLYDILADAMIHPERHEDQIKTLADTFAAVAPRLPRFMYEQAAGILLAALALEVLNVTAFQSHLNEVRARLTSPVWATNPISVSANAPGRSLPPLANGLHRKLRDEAETLARALGHNHIGTAHLLYALAALDGSVASAILQDVGLSADRLEGAIAYHLKADTSRNMRAPKHLPETEGVKYTFVGARETAAREDAEEASDEHVLQALLDMVDRDDDKGQSLAKVLRALRVPTTSDILGKLAASLDLLRFSRLQG